MAQMNAAVVTSFDEPPHYQQIELPQPTTPDEMLVDVLAVGLHPRARSGAAGVHYTSTGTLPMVPGIDGVGRRPDGKRIYFVARDDVIGTMAEKAIIDTRRAIELPDDVDVAKVAAAMNPAMSAWVALRRRVPIESGQSVLVLGATGNAGAMAVQVAKRLGAGRVIGAGRDLDRLSALASVGADDVVQLTADRDGRSARSGSRRGRHRDRLPVGQAGRAGHDGAPHRTLGPQPRHQLDPDRCDRRPDDRAPVRSPPFHEPTSARQRAGRCLDKRLPCRVAVTHR
jgi:NADPH:quinone reductase-like Zn-dependent oxidoreductase